MKIGLLCLDGSPLGVTSKTVWGDNFRVGVGGSELALITMCEEWTKAGHEVVLFNDPNELNASPFEQRTVSQFSVKEYWDVLINFRTPNPKFIAADNVGRKVWWSCDQYTQGDYRRFYESARPHKVVLISKTHANFFKQNYGIDGKTVHVIDLPIRLHDFDRQSCERVPYRVVWNSVPDRGLQVLWRMWPEMKRHIPELHLRILSDYRLWGAGAGDSQHRVRWIVRDDVTFLGAVNREQMITELLQADINIYPCVYEELFCIANAENQVAGVVPFTSNYGALSTTNMGVVMLSNPNNANDDKNWLARLMDFYRNKDAAEKRRAELIVLARERFSPYNILKQWDEQVFGG